MVLFRRQQLLFYWMVHLLGFWTHTLSYNVAHAVVISADGFDKNFLSTPVKRQEDFGKSINLRIRSTRPLDIPQVSEIISEALVDPDGQRASGFKFKLKMEMLRTKAGVESLLSSRMHAIHAGNNLLVQQELKEADQLRLLWSNDGFRHKLEKAALLSTEPHIWNRHNFACAPESSCWLQHKMMTAEDADSDEIVGFCELAMLSQPWQDEAGNDQCSIEGAAPTIVNLVTSARHRRQGIASKLMKTATRFVQRRWVSDELTLYVDKGNEAAVNMYENLGFENRAQVESRSGSQWYMSRQLDAEPTEGVTVVAS